MGFKFIEFLPHFAWLKCHQLQCELKKTRRDVLLKREFRIFGAINFQNQAQFLIQMRWPE